MKYLWKTVIGMGVIKCMQYCTRLMVDIKPYSVICLFSSFFPDDNSCEACKQPNTFEGLIDNFCRAEFGECRCCMGIGVLAYSVRTMAVNKRQSAANTTCHSVHSQVNGWNCQV